ncbi:MAG: helix-turn-helix domain-containing protein [Clostridiales bacterium]|nr:helix-turn-helix domain-containing protein [Clostridiales bacterium]MCD8370829.1 helix-turn-helix domain-containing protein [Clostridiales bacterium]
MYPEYPNIDLQETGRRIQSVIREAGYSVREVQDYLHLSCPQPIYRWFKGQILPSLNHVYALSKLLHVCMEDLLVVKDEKLQERIVDSRQENQWKRVLLYYRALCNVA